jgi:hypothetical protein
MMFVLKLEQRYLNLSHVVSASRERGRLEVVTPFEVVRLTGADAARVEQALERLAGRTDMRLGLPAAAQGEVQ